MSCTGIPDPPLDRGDAAATGSSTAQALPSRNASSKYDFVKVKVWLGENADHYYVLSRFLLSRMLTVTKVGPRFYQSANQSMPCTPHLLFYTILVDTDS